MRGQKQLSHIIGFDDAPFSKTHRGNVLVVGAVYSDLRLVGVLSGKVRRDGVNSTKTLIDLVSQSRFANHTQVILLNGIAFAGFNVIDLKRLHDALGMAAMAVVRKPPDLHRIREILLTRIPGGPEKWARIEQAGPVEPAAGVYVQRAGISLEEAVALIRHFAINSRIPEPLRTAHLIAGGIVLGESRHRV